MGQMNEGWGCGECKGRLKGWCFGGTEVFSDKVKVIESDGKGLGWVAEKEFDGA
jgi:hypothetical protein